MLRCCLLRSQARGKHTKPYYANCVGGEAAALPTSPYPVALSPGQGCVRGPEQDP